MDAPPAPSARDVLGWVAAAGGGPWFPSRHAAAHGVERDGLDAPLWELRQAGLVAVAAWEKGAGQGFAATPAGLKLLAAPEPDPTDPPADALPPDPDPPAVAAPALLFANVAWFAVGLFTAWKFGVGVEFLKADGHPGAVQMLYRTGAATGLSVLQGGWWRLATCCFVHVGLFHLLGNMLMLGMLGPVAEGLWGKRRFAVIYAVAGLAGSATAMAVNPSVTLAGASGALWGVLAAMLAWLLNHRRELPPDVAADAFRKLGLVAAINVVAGLAPNTSMAGHLGGGLAGFLASLFLDWPADKSMRRKALGILGTAGVLAATAGLLLGAMARSEKWAAVRDRDAAQKAERERARVQAAVGERWGRLTPPAVRAVLAPADAPLMVGPRRLPKAAARTREKARELGAAAEEAAAKSQAVPGDTGDRYRAYYGRVAAFAATLAAELDRPDPDTAAVSDRLADVDAAWAEATR